MTTSPIPSHFATAVQDTRSRFLLYSSALSIFNISGTGDSEEEKRVVAYRTRRDVGVKPDLTNGALVCGFDCQTVVKPGHLSCPRGVLYQVISAAQPVGNDAMDTSAPTDEEEQKVETGNVADVAGIAKPKAQGAAGTGADGPVRTRIAREQPWQVIPLAGERLLMKVLFELPPEFHAGDKS